MNISIVNNISYIYMTRYSDFVKRYMKQTGKSWNCAVCDIKKGDLYKGFKKDEDKQIRSDMEMMGGEDRDAPAPVKKKRKLRIVGQKKVKTLEPSPIPPPMALEPANPNTRTAMPLGVMPEILGQMIQDFIRPESKIKRLEDIRSLYDRLAKSGKLFTSNFRSKEQREYFKIVRPMLKQELENGYFTADDGKKIYFRVVGVHKRLEFLDKSKTKRGRVIKELKFETFPYQALLFALKARYKWRLGKLLTYELETRVSDLMELAPNLFGQDS
jgi:hypothetical protein